MSEEYIDEFVKKLIAFKIDEVLAQTIYDSLPKDRLLEVEIIDDGYFQGLTPDDKSRKIQHIGIFLDRKQVGVFNKHKYYDNDVNGKIIIDTDKFEMKITLDDKIEYYLISKKDEIISLEYLFLTRENDEDIYSSETTIINALNKQQSEYHLIESRVKAIKSDINLISADTIKEFVNTPHLKDMDIIIRRASLEEKDDNDFNYNDDVIYLDIIKAKDTDSYSIYILNPIENPLNLPSRKEALALITNTKHK